MSEKFLIPFSVLIGALIVGIAIYFATSSNKEVIVKESTNNQKTEQKGPRKVGENDYILGNKDAEIFIIEYSDLECPYCKTYNDGASKQLKEKYLENGKVAFVFRNFPLTIHPSAFGEAIATKCAGKLGGSEKYYKYKDSIFSETSSNGKFNAKRLPEIAESIGLNKTAFKACLKDDSIATKVKNDYQEGINAGVKGTPTVFIQLKSGETFPAVADFKVVNEAIQNYFNQEEATKKVTE